MTGKDPEKFLDMIVKDWMEGKRKDVIKQFFKEV